MAVSRVGCGKGSELRERAAGGVAHGAVDGVVLGHFFEDGRGVAVAGGGDEVDELKLDERILLAGQRSEDAGAHCGAAGVRVKGLEGAESDVGARIEGEGGDKVVQDLVVGLRGVGGGEDFAEAVVGGTLLLLEELVADELGHLAELLVLFGDLVTHGGEFALRVFGGGGRRGDGAIADDEADGDERAGGDGGKNPGEKRETTWGGSAGGSRRGRVCGGVFFLGEHGVEILPETRRGRRSGHGVERGEGLRESGEFALAIGAGGEVGAGFRMRDGGGATIKERGE